jgi:hypothetical protein
MCRSRPDLARRPNRSPRQPSRRHCGQECLIRNLRPARQSRLCGLPTRACRSTTLATVPIGFRAPAHDSSPVWWPQQRCTGAQWCRGCMPAPFCNTRRAWHHPDAPSPLSSEGSPLSAESGSSVTSMMLAGCRDGSDAGNCTGRGTGVQVAIAAGSDVEVAVAVTVGVLLAVAVGWACAPATSTSFTRHASRSGANGCRSILTKRSCRALVS